MTESILRACPLCQKRLRIKSRLAGKTLRCPGCDQPITVQEDLHVVAARKKKQPKLKTPTSAGPKQTIDSPLTRSGQPDDRKKRTKPVAAPPVPAKRGRSKLIALVSVGVVLLAAGGFFGIRSLVDSSPTDISQEVVALDGPRTLEPSDNSESTPKASVGDSDTSESDQAETPTELTSREVQVSNWVEAIGGSAITDGGFQLVIPPGAKISDDDFSKFQDLPHLTSLTVSNGETNFRINGPRVSDKAILQMKSLPRLGKIVLGGTRISDQGLQHLSQFPVKQLTIVRASITQNGLNHFSGHKLKRLAVSYCGRVTEEGLDKGVLSHIEELVLDGTTVTDDFFEKIGEASKIRVLSVRDTRMTADVCRRISGYESLEELEISNLKITDRELENLSGLRELKAFRVSRNKLKSAGIQFIADSFPGLETLDASYNDRRSLANVDWSGLQNLQALWLFGTPLRDAQLLAIADLPKLEHLGINNIRYSGSSISIDAMRQFQDKLPECKIANVLAKVHVEKMLAATRKTSSKTNRQTPASTKASSTPKKAQAKPVVKYDGPVIPVPKGLRPKSSIALAAADPKLKSLLKSIPSPEIRDNVATSIDLLLKDEKKVGHVIAVGKIEMPAGADTMSGGLPAGGLLLRQRDQRTVRFSSATFTYDGSVYGGRYNHKSHWPWFVTTLQPGRRARVKVLTLQHKMATIDVPETNDGFSVVLPPIRLRPVGKDGGLIVRASVSDGDKPLPSCAQLGLSGFTSTSNSLMRAAADGEIALRLPGELFDFQDTITISVNSAFHEGFSRTIRAKNVTGGSVDIGVKTLKVRPSYMVNTMFTNSTSLNAGFRSWVHCDTKVGRSYGMVRTSASVSTKHRLTVSKSGNSLTVNLGSMTHFADLGDDFPARSIMRPVESWLDVNDLRPDSSFVPVVGHSYLIKCREPKSESDPRWGLIQVEPATAAFDNFVATGKTFGPGFKALARRLSRYPDTGLRVVESNDGLSLRISSALDDGDAALMAKLSGQIFVEVPGTSRLTPDGLKQIARSQAVNYIKFTGWRIEAAHLQALGQSAVSRLRFESCQMLANFPALRLRSLTSLDVNKSAVGARFVAAFSGCPVLTSLSFSDCTGLRGQEAAFQYLPRSATSLRLSNCNVDQQLKSALWNQRGSTFNVNIYEK